MTILFIILSRDIQHKTCVQARWRQDRPSPNRQLLSISRAIPWEHGTLSANGRIGVAPESPVLPNCFLVLATDCAEKREIRDGSRSETQSGKSIERAKWMCVLQPARLSNYGVGPLSCIMEPGMYPS